MVLIAKMTLFYGLSPHWVTSQNSRFPCVSCSATTSCVSHGVGGALSYYIPLCQIIILVTAIFIGEDDDLCSCTWRGVVSTTTVQHPARVVAPFALKGLGLKVARWCTKRNGRPSNIQRWLLRGRDSKGWIPTLNQEPSKSAHQAPVNYQALSQSNKP